MTNHLYYTEWGKLKAYSLRLGTRCSLSALIFLEVVHEQLGKRNQWHQTWNGEMSIFVDGMVLYLEHTKHQNMLGGINLFKKVT